MKNLWVLIGSILATELTFELKENDEQCFFEEVNKGDNSNIEFEVEFTVRPPGSSSAVDRISVWTIWQLVRRLGEGLKGGKD